MKKLNLEGKRSGKLLVVSKSTKQRSDGSFSYWECLCDCGKKTTVKTSSISSEKTKSCGCLAVEKNSTHGMSGTPEHRSWKAMNTRCNNPNSKDYFRYGGRGIKICTRWKKFKNFYKDMGPSNGLTIDRKDSDGNYCKSNCRWVNRLEQSLNKKNKMLIKFNGERLSIRDWALLLNIKNTTLKNRIHNLKWSHEKALTTTVRNRK